MDRVFLELLRILDVVIFLNVRCISIWILVLGWLVKERMLKFYYGPTIYPFHLPLS